MIFDLIGYGSSQRDRLELKERRALKRKFISDLNSLRIKDEESIAGYMIDLGISDKYDKWKPLLVLPNAVRIFELAMEAVSLKGQTANIGLAVSRASKILFALKKYSRQSAHDESVKVDVVDNIETVLSIYSTNLRDVDVVRDFKPVSLINGRPDELNQVWTNLIYNSVQAMGQRAGWILPSASPKVKSGLK
ncbi:MAG: hypothetical protein WDN75_10335 [Bacteroidota bacterium]